MADDFRYLVSRHFFVIAYLILRLALSKFTSYHLGARISKPISSMADFNNRFAELVLFFIWHDEILNILFPSMLLNSCLKSHQRPKIDVSIEISKGIKELKWLCNQMYLFHRRDDYWNRFNKTCSSYYSGNLCAVLVNDLIIN